MGMSQSKKQTKTEAAEALRRLKGGGGEAAWEQLAAPPRAAARARGPRLPTLGSVPTQADVEAMTEPERRALLLQLGVLGQQVAAAQGMVAALLDVRSD